MIIISCAASSLLKYIKHDLSKFTSSLFSMVYMESCFKIIFASI